MKARFTYSCLKNVVDACEARNGYRDDNLRVCDHCGKYELASKSYCLVPIDMGAWLRQDPNLVKFKEFGPNRCEDCLPADSICADEYMASPRKGWQFSSTLYTNEI